MQNQERHLVLVFDLEPGVEETSTHRMDPIESTAYAKALW